MVIQKKLDYSVKLNSYLNNFEKVITLNVNNVGSKKIAYMRKKLRERNIQILMGKNTIIRKILSERATRLEETDPEKSKNALSMIDMIKGNIGFAFLPEDESITLVRKEIVNDKTKTSAKAGMIAPSDVIVPSGPTNQDPSQTSFFQALDIPTKISRGQIEIVNDVELIHKGKKIDRSASELLIKLGIKPFYFGITVSSVYDKGDIYSSNVLDITESDITCAFIKSVRILASFCLGIDYPTSASVLHTILNSYKDVLAIGLECKLYSWDNLTKVKEIIENPILPQINDLSTNNESHPIIEISEKEESSEVGGGLFNSDSSNDSSN